MAYLGFLSFGGQEIINQARLSTYVHNLAAGAIRDCDCECEGLHEYLGDQEYTTPLNDDAPWADPGHGASQDFLGVLPLDAQGLEDSSRETPYVQLIGDGGAVTGRRHAAKEVRFHALLVGRTDEGVDHGFTWLNNALRGSVPGECGPGDDLCWFVACPQPGLSGPLVELDMDLRPKETIGFGTQSSPDMTGWPYVDGSGSWDGLTFRSTNAGETLRTNYVTNPSPASAAGYGITPASAEMDYVDGWLRVTTIASTTAFLQTTQPYVSVDTSEGITGSVRLRVPVDAEPLRVRLALWEYQGTTVVDNSETSGWVEMNPGDDITLSHTITPDAETDSIRILIYPQSQAGSPAPGLTLEAQHFLISSEAGYFDGDSPADGSTYYEWSGAPNASTSREVAYTETPARLMLPRLNVSNVCAPITWHLEISSPEPARIRVTLQTDAGETYQQDVEIGPTRTTVFIQDNGQAESWAQPSIEFLASGGSWEPYHGASFNEGGSSSLTHAQWFEGGSAPLTEAQFESFSTAPGVGELSIHEARLTYRKQATPFECADDLTRRLRGVFTIDGPKVIRKFRTHKGVFWEVDFTVGAMTPWRYTLETPIIDSTRRFLDPVYPGARMRQLSSTVPECRVERPVSIVDPACPTLPPPPRVEPADPGCWDERFAPGQGFGTNQSTPDLLDALGVQYETDAFNQRRPVTRTYLASIPASAVPRNKEAVPVIRVKAQGSSPVRNARVRFIRSPWDWDDIDRIDPCSVCGDFTIDYIPPGATFTIDGMRENAFITLAGDSVAPAGHLLSGPSPTRLFNWPTLVCSGYVMVVDVMDTDGVAIDISLATRE